VTIRYFTDLVQGTDEWLAARCGLLTASEMKLIITPTLKTASNDKERAHLYELLAQRITRYVEPAYISDDMLRGREDEIEARALYAERYAPVREVGFVTRDDWGFTLGASPDGLVGDDGMIECKSRRQKYQVQTIVEHWRDGTTPDDYTLQVQTAMLVTGRKWCDLISYSGGLPMIPMRIERNDQICAAIEAACADAEAKIAAAIEDYHAAVEARKLLPTERRVEMEMYV